MNTFLLGFDGELSHARLGRVHRGTAQLLLRHVFARHGLHDLRAGEEHIRGTLLHDDEVGQRRRIDGTAGTGAEDGRNLRNDTRAHHVTLENVGITRQSVHTLLDTGTARIVQTDAGSAVAHRHIHNLADLVGHRKRQRTCRHGEVLGKDIDQAAFDRTVTRYHTVAERMLLLHTEVVATMRDEHVELLEATLVEQHLDTLACGVLTLLVLLVDRLLTTAHTSHLAVLDELVDLVLNFTHNRKYAVKLFILVLAKLRQDALGGFRMQESDGHALGTLAGRSVDQTDALGGCIGQLLLDILAGECHVVDTDALVLDELGDGRFGRRRLEQLDLRLAQLEERRADFLVGNLFDRITFQTQYVFPIGNRLIQTFDCNAKMLNVRYFHNFKRFN